MTQTTEVRPLRLGDEAPDFTAQTTEGPVRFHEWLGSDWGVLFSHPRAFTPVCTTELGTVARIREEFDRRGVKVMGLSVDPVDDVERWSRDIVETQGHAPTSRSSPTPTARWRRCTGWSTPTSTTPRPCARCS